MRALFGITEAVPLSRVARDYRGWLIPLVLALVVNAAVLTLVVVPLATVGRRQRAPGGGRRRDAAVGAGRT